jgi:multidrug efflux pump
MEYSINYDPTLFTQQSIDAVYETLRDAIILVVIVVMLFLQSWRIALIPLIAVPVSLIGTFAVMALMGFSLNSLSLFGLVLAIGIVVDDAIVVVENWSLPLAVILIVPMCLLSAMAGVYFRGQDNNIFTQIGFIVLVGLACKNAILIVEFTRQEMLSGKGRIEAAVEASRLRLRPILMTSFAFILGVLPLVIAKGAGAEMDQALGTAVFAGMIGVTFFGIFLTPVFFSVIMKIFTWAPKQKQQRSIERRGLKEKPVH